MCHLFLCFVSFLCRSHLCPQPHFHLTWNLLHPNRSSRAGALAVQTKDPGTAQFLQVSLYLPLQPTWWLICALCPPTGHMLRCSGLHLHGDEFVVYHHWLGVWRVQKRRWTLKKTLRKRFRQNTNQRSPPPPLSNCPWSPKSEGCAENLQKHKKDEEGENTEASVFWWEPTSAAPLSSGGWRQNHGMNKSSVTRAQTPFLEHGCADVCGIVQSPPTSPLSHLRTRKLLLRFQELTTPKRPFGNINMLIKFLKEKLKTIWN